MPRHGYRAPATALIAASAAALVSLAGCKAPPPERGREVKAPVLREVPSALRGTVGAEAQLGRANAVLVAGYGLVVGLNGTGGGDLDERIAATMERQLGLMGISKGSAELQGTQFEGMSPREILRSRDVAVVTVYSAVVPGAPEGASFDVFVRAVNPSPDLSLEGGLLWTTELQIGPPQPITGYNKKAIARAYGPIFINPFADEGPDTSYGRNVGRILGGGTVTNPLPLQLVLDNESHARARAITYAINQRFPQQAGQEPTARGRNSRVVEIAVPAEYRERSSEFLNLLLHVQTYTSVPQEFANRYAQSLKNEPYLSDDMRWCLQALPQKASLPFLRDLYDHPEQRVRLAALRAGAGQGDALTASHLKRLTREGGTTEERIEAIELLGRLSAGPTVDLALQDQLEAPELSVRVAAYEALAQRAEQVQRRRFESYKASLPATAKIALEQRPVSARAQLEIPGDTMQGVQRRVADGKFLLDIVPRGRPMIYVTQSGRPRVVLFGSGLEIKKPTLVSAWGDRLMLAADSPTDDLRVLYRTPDRRSIEGELIPGRGVTGKAPATVPEFVQFLAHTPRPEDPRPGLGMTYSEVVGALHAFHKAGAIAAEFAVESDVLQARLLEATQRPESEDRPETNLEAETREKVKVFEPATNPVPEPPKPVEPSSKVVPLPAPVEKGKK